MTECSLNGLSNSITSADVPDISGKQDVPATGEQFALVSQLSSGGSATWESKLFINDTQSSSGYVPQQASISWYKPSLAGGFDYSYGIYDPRRFV